MTVVEKHLPRARIVPVRQLARRPKRRKNPRFAVSRRDVGNGVVEEMSRKRPSKGKDLISVPRFVPVPCCVPWHSGCRKRETDVETKRAGRSLSMRRFARRTAISLCCLIRVRQLEVRVCDLARLNDPLSKNRRNDCPIHANMSVANKFIRTLAVRVSRPTAGKMVRPPSTLADNTWPASAGDRGTLAGQKTSSGPPPVICGPLVRTPPPRYACHRVTSDRESSLSTSWRLVDLRRW